MTSLSSLIERLERASGPDVVLAALNTVPAGYWQRVDGLRCESSVLHMSNCAFRWSIRLLKWRGRIRQGVALGAWWSMPTYQITDAGRAALRARAAKEGGGNG